MKNNDGQVSLFDMFDIEGNVSDGVKLQIIKSSFETQEELTWEELFQGFDELYAITFSSGVNFCAKLLEKFNYAEIIFGNEAVITPTMEAIIAGQEELIKYISKSKVLVSYIERLKNNTLYLYVAKDIRSHEKIYCLKANDGRRRVIIGSANMSATAFYGMQREVISYYDGEAAYDYFFNRFSVYKNSCSNEVAKETLLCVEGNQEYLDENIEKIPVIQELQKKETIILEESEESDLDSVEIVTKVKGLENQLKPMMPKPKKERGKTVITSSNIKKFIKERKDNYEEQKMKKKSLPRLHLDYDKETLSFNDEPYSLMPDKELVKSDVLCLTGYLSSLKRFSGDVANAEKDYYAFFNWYFASIFIPKLRYIASRTNYGVTDYPVFGIIYGESNGAKSTFVSLLSKLMTGKKIPANSNDDFTTTNIERLKRGCEGVPIYIDDLVKQQYQSHAEKIIKDDQWGLQEAFINYSAVVVTTNSVPSLKIALAKRTIAKNISIRIDKEEGSKSAKMVNESIQKATNSLFCEYVRRMLPLINNMFEEMRKGDVNYFPDLYKISSQTLYDIISEILGDDLPEYISVLTYSDYFGDKVVGRNAIEKIKLAWETEPKLFQIDEKKNRLVYRCPENGATYELKYLKDELPTKLEVQVNQSTLVMNLKEARSYFGKKFKKNIFGKYV